MNLSQQGISRFRRMVRSLFGGRPGRLVREGERRLLAGDGEGAEVALGAATDLSPGWAEPWYLLARCAALLGDRGREEDHLRTALARDPDHGLARDALSALRAWRYRPIMDSWHRRLAGEPSAALARFRLAEAEVGARVPRELWPEIRTGIGWCLLDLGDAAGAREAFAGATAADPLLAQAHKGLGISAWHLGDLDAAEIALQAALDIEAGLFDAQSFLGWCAYSRGDYADARRAFLRASEMNPLAVDPVWGRAWSEWRRGRREEAVADFEEAIRKGPLHPSRSDFLRLAGRTARLAPHRVQLARALVGAGRFEEALAAFDFFAPEDVTDEVHVLCALALLRLARPVEAEASLLAVPEDRRDVVYEEPLESSDPELRTVGLNVRQLLGRTAHQLGRLDEARGFLLAAVEASPTLASAHLDLGRVCLDSHAFAEADRHLREARADLGLRRRADRVLKDVARRQRLPVLDALEACRRGDAAHALACLEATPEGHGRLAALAGIVRGRALLALGRCTEAAGALGAAHAAEPDSPWPALWLAHALEQDGRTSEARTAIERQLDRNPEHPDLLQVGGRLAETCGESGRARKLRARVPAEFVPLREGLPDWAAGEMNEESLT